MTLWQSSSKYTASRPTLPAGTAPCVPPRSRCLLPARPLTPIRLPPRQIVDIPLGHPSCSKQHAVLQFRLIKTRNAYGDESSGVKPFLIDLDSTNGCSVNGAEIPPSRYYELKASDGARPPPSFARVGDLR